MLSGNVLLTGGISERKPENEEKFSVEFTVSGTFPSEVLPHIAATPPPPWFPFLRPTFLRDPPILQHKLTRRSGTRHHLHPSTILIYRPSLHRTLPQPQITNTNLKMDSFGSQQQSGGRACFTCEFFFPRATSPYITSDIPPPIRSCIPLRAAKHLGGRPSRCRRFSSAVCKASRDRKRPHCLYVQLFGGASNSRCSQSWHQRLRRLPQRDMLADCRWMNPHKHLYTPTFLTACWI